VFSRHLAVTEIKPPVKQHSSQFWRILSSGFLILFAKQEAGSRKQETGNRKQEMDKILPQNKMGRTCLAPHL
jgi:hypothetical protein